MAPYLKNAHKTGGQTSSQQLGSGPFDQLNERAAAYANERAAELVGMKWIDGLLVDNPDAEWAITETTREDIKAAISRAFEEGMSPADLATEIAALVDDEARADMISRTELAMAQTAGALDAARESGVVSGKEWLVADNPCEECSGNADDGVIPLDDVFSSGDDGPPVHQNCECDLAMAIDESDESDQTE